MKNYIGKNEIFHTEAEKRIGFFLRPLVFARYPISWKLAILQNGVKKNRFSRKAGKIPLVIYQTLCLSSLIANNALKRKLGAICVLRGRKKALKIQKSKNFDVFSFSKYDISRTVPPILMIFFANYSQFNFPFR